LTTAAEVPKKLVSKAPEELGLSELLSTPQEMLQTERSTELPEDNLGDMFKVSDVSSLVSKEMPEPVNVERQSFKTGGGADLAKALGLERLSADQQNMLNETVANTVKETVAGMMRTLRARSEIKSEFRMNMTTIQSAENNPLKFSVTPDDAIENMFAKEGKAYLSPVDAMNDGFADISDHQVALFDAMKAAYEHILGQFDPSTLTRKFEKTTSKRFLGGGKGKNWDAYQSLFEEYKEDNELTFKRLFGEVFADAYERRMHSLKMNRSSASGKKSVK
jgi:type VI secretion system FHA domain protein